MPSLLFFLHAFKLRGVPKCAIVSSCELTEIRGNPAITGRPLIEDQSQVLKTAFYCGSTSLTIYMTVLLSISCADDHSSFPPLTYS